MMPVQLSFFIRRCYAELLCFGVASVAARGKIAVQDSNYRFEE